MKNQVFAVVVLFFLISSCSSDDSPSVNETPETPTGTVLAKTIYTEYLPSPNNVKTTIVEFEEGLPVRIARYTSADILVQEEDWYYNSSGLIDHSVFATNNEQINIAFLYDEQNRLYRVTQDKVNGYHVEVNYTFNPDNTVTCVGTGITGVWKTIFLNDQNFPYKAIDAFDEITEVNYNADNLPVSLTNEDSQTTYTYDNDHNPALLNVSNIFGNYTNACLRKLYLSPDNDAMSYDKYLTKYVVINGTGVTTTDEMVYTWNTLGLPVKMLHYRNDVLLSEKVFVYE